MIKIKAMIREGIIFFMVILSFFYSSILLFLCNYSLYKLQIEQYLKYFPIERFRFFLTEDLRQKKVEILQQVCRHFEIDDSLENFNLEKPSSNVSSDFREILVKRKMRNLPGVKSILPLIPSFRQE